MAERIETMRERERVQTPGGGREMTKQQFKRDCDVNHVVAQYRQTGQLTSSNPKQPLYGDFSTAVTLQDALDLVRRAEADFMALPSSVRKAADHSPVELLRMMATPEGVAELKRAGLAIAEPEGIDTPSRGEEAAPASADEASGGGVTQTN